MKGTKMPIRRRAVLDRTQRLSALAVAGAVLGPAAVACGPAGGQPAGEPGAGGQAGQAVKGGTVTFGNFADGATLQPLLIQDTASRAYESAHYSAPLLRYDPDTLALDTKYGTAESFQQSPDGLTYTFKLKNNILWSDGKPITAQDYKFTWDKMMDPKVDYPYRSNLRYFDTLTAPDDRTLVFKLKEAFCPAVDYANLNPIPKHIFENLDINDNPLNQKPTVGSGPWLLQEWRKDSEAIFTANDKFYLGRPNLDRIVYRIVKDQTVAYSMLKTGEIDQSGIQAIDWDEAKRLPNIQAMNYYPASASWVYIGYNMRNEMLKDVRVRQALAHMMDRKKVIDAIRLGHAKPINSIFASASWAFSDDVPKYEYEVAKAKSLLDAAGWRTPANDPNGTRVKDGKPMKMRIFYNAGNKEREQLATIAQQYAKAVGVELEVIAEEWNAYLNRVNRTRDMEMYVLGWSSGLEPHGSQNIWITDGGQNATGFSNAQVDELFPKAAAVPSCSQADRKRVYAEIQKLVSADPPYIFMWESEVLSGLNSRLVPNKMSKLGYDYRPWEWYSKTGK
jgi:peptide/nickel transport system substrate-binding protein